ncbi:hypothetical protein, partial [Oceanicola granulosus]
LAFADVPRESTGDATAMMGALQQVAIATGVALAGAVLEVGMVMSGRDLAAPMDFSAAFFVVGLVTMSAAFAFIPMGREAGSEVSGRRVPAE